MCNDHVCCIGFKLLYYTWYIDDELLSFQMVIVFRGTETTKEWIENANLFMELLDGEASESGLDRIFSHSVGEACPLQATTPRLGVVIIASKSLFQPLGVYHSASVANPLL